MLIENRVEATRVGIRGFAREALIFSRPWGFRLEDITMEVHLWHGEEDASTPLPMAQYVASAIPNCHATFLPGEGHSCFSTTGERFLPYWSLEGVKLQAYFEVALEPGIRNTSLMQKEAGNF